MIFACPSTYWDPQLKKLLSADASGSNKGSTITKTDGWINSASMWCFRWPKISQTTVLPACGPYAIENNLAVVIVFVSMFAIFSGFEPLVTSFALHHPPPAQCMYTSPLRFVSKLLLRVQLLVDMKRMAVHHCDRNQIFCIKLLHLQCRHDGKWHLELAFNKCSWHNIGQQQYAPVVRA